MPQLRKVTEENIHIIRDCAAGRISCAEAAERCGMSFESTCRWVSRYHAEGASVFLPAQHISTYSPYLKEAAVKAYLLGRSRL